MKSKQNSIPSPHPRQLFLEWYHSSILGKALRKTEASYLLNSIQLTYNQKILQVGPLGSENLFIGDEFCDNFAMIDADEGGGTLLMSRIRAKYDEIPITGESIDVLILPHVLEFEPNPHQVLGEAERILKPEGQLIVLGFNPWSLHGIVSHLPRQHTFPQKNFIGCYRLMDWLSLLKLDAEFNAGFGLTASRTIFKPDTFISKSMAYLATAYAVRAVKRTYTLIPIKPAWISGTGLIPGRAVDTPLMRKH